MRLDIRLGLCAALLPIAGHAQQFAYVSNQIGNTVSVVNLQTGQVSATLSTGFHPAGVALSPDGARLYVVNADSNSLSIFTTASNSIFGTLGVGQQLPVAVAASPNGQRIYTANAGNASVSVFNALTFALLANIRVGFTPSALAVTADSGRVYVANANSNTVSVINTTNNTVLATIPVGSTPVSLAMTPDGNSVYAANQGSNTLSKIDLSTNTVTAALNLGKTPASLAFGPDGSASVSTFGSSSVLLVDAAGNTVRGAVETPVCLGVRCVSLGVAVSADGKQLYVVDSSSNNLLVVNTDTREILKSISVGEGPRSIVLSPAPKPAAADAGEEGGAN